MSPRLRSIVAAFVVLLMLSACTPADPMPTATPTQKPTFQCTPIFSGDVYGCDQSEVEELAAERARYDEAATLYEGVTRQIEDLLAANGEITPDLEGELSGDYLDEVTASLTRFASAKAVVSGHRTLEWAQPSSRRNKGSDLAIEVCSSPGDFSMEIDGTAAPRVFIRELVFLMDDGTLRLDSSKAAEVDSC